ncbi:MAG: PH domain-containing protein [Methanolinea sp.]|jgi:putative membrane protein|nr:PH domain-containing protein [Methanolinea sp.]
MPDGELVFTPSPRLRAFYLFLLVLVTWLILFPLLILVALSSTVHFTLSVVIPLFVILLAIRWWIPKYWASLRFRFTATELVCEKGVWRNTLKSVPYSRIRDIGIECGIVCRYLGIAGLRVMRENGEAIHLPGVEEQEIVRDILLERIRGAGSAQV